MLKKLKSKYSILPIGVKAALWYTACNVLQKGIAIIVVPIYTRLLTPDNYGSYSVFMSWAELFEIIVTFRLFFGAYLVGLVKFEDDQERYTSSLEQLTLMITSVFFVLYLIFKEPVNTLTKLTTEQMMLMFLLLITIPVVGFWKSFQRVNNKYKEMVVAVLGIAILSPLLGISGILLIEKSANIVIAARVSSETIVAIILFARYAGLFIKKPDVKYWKYALAINIPLIPYYLSTIILNHSDRIIIQQLVGSKEAGIYSVAYSAAMVTVLFNTAFDGAIQPWLFRKIKAKEYNEVPGILNFSLLIVGILNILLIAFGPEVIKILAPAPYHEAIWIIPPLASSVFVMYVYIRFINIEFYYGESKLTGFASIGAAILNVALNFAFIPIFGYLVAGYTTLFSYIAFGIMHFIYTRKICKKYECPMSMFGIADELKLIALFAATAILFGAFYKITLVRYAMILAIMAGCIIKRNELIEKLKYLTSLKKQAKENNND